MTVETEMTFSTYARRYGLLPVARARWHSPASQLLRQIAGNENRRVDASTDGSDFESISVFSSVRLVHFVCVYTYILSLAEILAQI